MSISTTVIIIGLVLGGILGAAIVIWRQYYRDLFGGLLVAGILALAVVVTIYQVNQYRTQKAEAALLAQSPPAQPEPMSGSSSPPPVAVPMLPPGVRGATGAAAPAATHSPYAGSP